MKNIYLASPFFSDKQEKRLHTVKDLLKSNPTVGSIYLPEEHQLESEDEYSFPWQVGVFAQDVRQITSNDVVVCILDYVTHGGEVIADTGSAWEAGYAYANNIPIIYVQFDKTSQMNLMVAQSGTAFFEEDKIEKIKNYNFENLPQIFTNQPVF